ncbi:MurR/RpiR family transcriptional regulator [Pseudonocardia acaciae]|uniref:MurR/RpiR family transcriptional regulator n=1 Tax=Pseudonocardia acaciae TaxID=551276 RepID=UPI00056635DF|nr:MurR/RpiR family transcriptional regulator [Pseudonocardia acaciae]
MTSDLTKRIAQLRDQLGDGGLRVVDFLALHPTEASVFSAREIADRAGVSDATVVRTVKQLGYSGLAEMRRAAAAMLNPVRDPEQTLAEHLVRSDDGGRLLDRIGLDAAQLARALPRAVPAEVFETATRILADAGHALIVGYGSAQPVADALALGLRRIGRTASATSLTGYNFADELGQLSAASALVLVAPLRHVREHDVAISEAARAGCPVVVITEVLASHFADRVETILVTPSTENTLTGPPVVQLMLVDALLLAVAATDPDRALEGWRTTNRLRTEIVGGNMDVPLNRSNAARVTRAQPDATRGR